MDKEMASGQGDGKWTRRWQVDKEMASGQGDGKWTRRWQVDKEMASGHGDGKWTRKSSAYLESNNLSSTMCCTPLSNV